ncbi:MAG: hypothetical protein JWM68_1489 [Verrucomicrobiales bacterium]|nr:hypothetical protein [Verrucomicrobiales bacterium]
MNFLFAELLAKNGPEVLWIFVPLVGLAVVIRLMAGNQDDARIRQEIERKGGSVIKILWNPLGPGWFGDKNNRLYEVTYRDRNGQTIVANCKTNMFSGVYWSDPRVLDEVANEKPGPMDNVK